MHRRIHFGTISEIEFLLPPPPPKNSGDQPIHELAPPSLSPSGDNVAADCCLSQQQNTQAHSLVSISWPLFSPGQAMPVCAS